MPKFAYAILAFIFTFYVALASDFPYFVYGATFQRFCRTLLLQSHDFVTHTKSRFVNKRFLFPFQCIYSNTSTLCKFVYLSYVKAGLALVPAQKAAWLNMPVKPILCVPT